MARILIGWELGANRGHADRLSRLAALLRAQGHVTSFALQRIDALTLEEAGGSPVWQAPVTPRLLVSAPQSRRGPPAGMAEILVRLGIDDPGLVAAMVGGWQRLIAAERADLVLGDFSPFLLLAARGRLPSILVGTGFTVPPSDMASFPRLIERVESVDQAAVLERLNAGIAAAGGERVERLPQAFEADRAFAASFAELDPYARQRAGPLLSPLPEDFDSAAEAGDEVFVYAPETLAPDAPLWDGLAASGLPVRVHVPRATAPVRERLAGLGLAFEPEPLPFARIAERSRILVSHGGHGFVCAGLAAGLPQVVCHYDVEKLLHGLAIARLGLGGHVSLASIDAKAFGASLSALHRDEALAARARAAAAGFRARGAPFEPALVEAAAALT